LNVVDSGALASPYIDSSGINNSIMEQCKNTQLTINRAKAEGKTNNLLYTAAFSKFLIRTDKLQLSQA